MSASIEAEPLTAKDAKITRMEPQINADKRGNVQRLNHKGHEGHKGRPTIEPPSTPREPRSLTTKDTKDTKENRLTPHPSALIPHPSD
jgi:hypothetical protein